MIPLTAFFAFTTGAIVTWAFCEWRVIEAQRLRDNAITSRDAHRSKRLAPPAPKPEPLAPVNRLAAYFRDNP